MENYECLDVRPYQLMCIVCRLGAAPNDHYFHAERLDRITNTVMHNPSIPVRLRCNVSSVYRYQNCGDGENTPEGGLFNRRRDLTILQRLGLVPGDTRPAIELFHRMIDTIDSVGDICGVESSPPGTSHEPDAGASAWTGCRLSGTGNFERGRTRAIQKLFAGRTDREKAQTKLTSSREIYDAKSLRLRPHHLLCMTCFHAGRTDLGPIEEDNLFEAIDMIQRHPAIPVTLIEGCCQICPPCSRYEPESGLCVSRNGMGLRDEKKDLEVLRMLGLEYGDTVSGSTLLATIYDRIETTTCVCGYGDGRTRSYEWTVCGGPEGNPGYLDGRAAGLGVRVVGDQDHDTIEGGPFSS